MSFTEETESLSEPNAKGDQKTTSGPETVTDSVGEENSKVEGSQKIKDSHKKIEQSQETLRTGYEFEDDYDHHSEVDDSEEKRERRELDEDSAVGSNQARKEDQVSRTNSKHAGDLESKPDFDPTPASDSKVINMAQEMSPAEEVNMSEEEIGNVVAPRFPPLSGATCRSRTSQSSTYNNTSPEWYWKISPTLPELWLRDCHRLSEVVVTNLEASWKDYQSLNIPGSGDGSGSSAWTLEGRKQLKKEYGKLHANVRKAKEVALARYDCFAIAVAPGGDDWALDYHVDFAEGEGNFRGKKGGKGKHTGCAVM